MGARDGAETRSACRHGQDTTATGATDAVHEQGCENVFQACWPLAAVRPADIRADAVASGAGSRPEVVKSVAGGATDMMREKPGAGHGACEEHGDKRVVLRSTFIGVESAAAPLRRVRSHSPSRASTCCAQAQAAKGTALVQTAARAEQGVRVLCPNNGTSAKHGAHAGGAPADASVAAAKSVGSVRVGAARTTTARIREARAGLDVRGGHESAARGRSPRALSTACTLACRSTVPSSHSCAAPQRRLCSERVLSLGPWRPRTRARLRSEAARQ